MPQINVYFIHAKHLKEREKIINDFRNNLQKYSFKNYCKIQIKVIEKFDPGQDLISDVIKNNIDYSPLKDSLSWYNGALKNMHLFQVSNCMKHFEAIQLAGKTHDNDINLILEDDVLYEDKVFINLEKIIDKISTINYDVVFLGLPTTKEITNKETEFHKIKDLYPMLPYCDSYLIQKKAALKLCSSFMPIKFVSNIQLSYLIEKLSLDARVAIPNIFMEASKFGMFLSSLNPNNQLFFNRDYMELQNILNRDVTPTNISRAHKLYESSQIKENPDFIYLYAKFLCLEKKFSESLSIYQNILPIYQKGAPGLINQESNFLRDHIRLYKHLQII